MTKELQRPYLAQELRDAADTIWQLRDDLQQANAENAKLHDRITTQKQTIQVYRDESREWREVAERAQAENEKLREYIERKKGLQDFARLVGENSKLRELCGRELLIIEDNCGACAYFYDCNIMNDCKCVAPKKIRDELSELGVDA